MLREEIDRALRQRHGDEVQDKLYQARVAIAGIGGVGSHIAYMLARAGVGHLHLIDFDVVDITNIHRQQYSCLDIGEKKTAALAAAISGINPFLDVRTSDCRVTEDNMGELFQDADIIIEAFDKPEAKAMLVNYALEHFPEKYLIANSGMAGYGDSNLIHTRKCMKKFYICGDEQADVEKEGTLFAARVAICSGHAANLAIRLILENER